MQSSPAEKRKSPLGWKQRELMSWQWASCSWPTLRREDRPSAQTIRKRLMRLSPPVVASRSPQGEKAQQQTGRVWLSELRSSLFRSTTEAMSQVWPLSRLAKGCRSQRATSPDWLTEARWKAWTARHQTVSSWAAMVVTRTQSSSSRSRVQTLIVLSQLAEKSRVLSLAQQTNFTSWECPVITETQSISRSSLSSSRSQTKMLWSREEEARKSPEGCQSTLFTSLSWPSRVVTLTKPREPSRRWSVQMTTKASKPPLARQLPQWDQERHRMLLVCSSRTQHFSWYSVPSLTNSFMLRSEEAVAIMSSFGWCFTFQTVSEWATRKWSSTKGESESILFQIYYQSLGDRLQLMPGGQNALFPRFDTHLTLLERPQQLL